MAKAGLQGSRRRLQRTRHESLRRSDTKCRDISARSPELNDIADVVPDAGLIGPPWPLASKWSDEQKASPKARPTMTTMTTMAATPAMAPMPAMAPARLGRQARQRP